MTGFEIRDAAGELVAIHERIDGPDGKRFVWRQPDRTPGLGGLPIVDLPLYGVQHLNGKATVVLTEGEKAADALITAGVPAVASVTGAAATPGRAALADLTGRDVVLWPDADEVGEAHMARIAAGLVGIAASVRMISWPDAPAHGDAADYAGDPWDLIDTARRVGPDLPDAPTYRTLAEIDDAAPAPLILGMLEPTGPTLAYAAPGVGKGTTGSWIIRECQALGMRPAVYDAETRPREWSRRCAGLGVDRSRVPYITPADLGPKYAGRPLWESAPVLGSILQSAGADLLLVDSILPACSVGEDRLRSDAQTPFLFVSALEALGIPSLSFGHTPKGSPEGDPFGSFAWIAAMRLTWIGARAEGDGHRVRWRPRKRNERGHVPGILLAFDYDADGRLCGVTREDDEESTRDRLLAALVGGPRSAGDLADELLEDDDEPPTPDRRERTLERLKKALQRMRREGWVLKDGTTRNVVWRLAERPR
jgi:YD repeat-containing protein